MPFFKSINIPQPNSLLSMDWRMDSVIEIRAWVVEHSVEIKLTTAKSQKKKNEINNIHSLLTI